MTSAFRIVPGNLSAEASGWHLPAALIDLDDTPWPDEVRLPVCPLIGLGDRDHPEARHVDIVIEPPVKVDRLLSGILARPQAAAVLVQLLRLIENLGPAEALTAESLAYAVLQGSLEHRLWLDAAARTSGPPGSVSLDRREDVLAVTLERPLAGNAIDRPMRDALYEAFELAALDASIKRVVLRGAGRTFSLGADLGEFGTTIAPAMAHAIRCRTLPAWQAWRIAGRLHAHIHGACVGAGLEIAAWAARLTATRTAWFQLPELAMGIIPGAGGCVSLTRRIGRHRTALMALSGKRIGAATALDWGLVDAIVDDHP